MALVVEKVLPPEKKPSAVKLPLAEPPVLMETVPPPPVELKVAVTDRAAVMERAHVPVPLHEPLHPANVEPPAALAVSVTAAPLAKPALHVLPQLMPAGEEVTVPLPDPDFVTVSATPDTSFSASRTALYAGFLLPAPSKSSGFSPWRQESLSRTPQTVMPTQRGTFRHALVTLPYAVAGALAMSSSVIATSTPRP